MNRNTHLSVSCQEGDCRRCSIPPGKSVRVPQSDLIVAAADIAPSCTHDCHFV